MKYCYTDFIPTILDYFCTLKKGELFYEWGIPFLISGVFYYNADYFLTSDFKKDVATILIPMLTGVFAILVGFTITAIAIFTTADRAKTPILDKESDRSILDVKISYFRFVYVHLIFSAIAGLGMLVVAISSFFLLSSSLPAHQVIISILIFGTLLNILLTVRNATNLYYIFFRR